MPEKAVLLLDGGFVKKKLAAKLGRFPSPHDIIDVCESIMKHPRLEGRTLFRVYFYDAPPHDGRSKNPVDGTLINFSTTSQAAQNRTLLDALELQDDFAVRRGIIILTGWKLGKKALKSLAKTKRSITASDIVPDMAQKGVDIRIGLDIAWIALKRIADVLVLVTGDSDFVPAMKFARKEGLKVYLERMEHPVRRELMANADLVL